jgi:hypothetical protein
VDPSRQQLSIALLGVLVGGTAGAIFGVAIGTTSNPTGITTQIETVVRTQNLTKTQLLPVATAPPQTVDTGPVDTVPPIVAPNVTPPGFGTTTTSATPTTSTPIASANQNDVQPADPANPPPTFCDTHVCGPSFAKGDGPAVECANGVWTRQGGETVTCSTDGGLGKASGGP